MLNTSFFLMSSFRFEEELKFDDEIDFMLGMNDQFAAFYGYGLL